MQSKNTFQNIQSRWPYQMLGHLDGDGSHLLTVLADHLLDDVGEVVVLGLAHDVKQSLHHWPDERGDVLFGCRWSERKEKKSCLL